MNIAMTLNFLTGMSLAVAAFAIAIRHILLSPRNSTFPCAPRSVRVVMFLLAAGFAYLAVEFLSADTRGTFPWAGQGATAIAVLCGGIAIYNIVLAINVLSQRLPPGLWRRLDRIEANARRPRGNPSMPLWRG